LMYLQQGVQSVLSRFTRKHPVLSSHIDFERQEKNALLAISSSADQRFATIDLSAASDCVTTRLVKAVFHGTSLLPYLLALRSRIAVLPSGTEVELAKYAPMGSALCFPVETLVFAAAVEFAVRRARATYLGNFPKWRVYGDDIIVSDALFGDVILVLEAIGFQVNASKSFSSPAHFRESCGGEGFDGATVTPMKISRRFRSIRDRVTAYHASEYAGLVDMANTAYDYQFPLLRAWVIEVLLQNPVAPPLFSGLGHGAVFSPWADNYRARSRFNLNLQRREVKVAMVDAPELGKAPVDQVLERARYFETLRQSYRRTGDMFEPEHRIKVPRGTGKLRLRSRWVERPDGV